MEDVREDKELLYKESQDRGDYAVQLFFNEPDISVSHFLRLDTSRDRISNNYLSFSKPL